MRYSTFTFIRFTIITLLAVPFFVFAQQGNSNSVEVMPSHIQLPSKNGGIMPESPFYFFDKAGEAIQELFTFNPETKVALQLTFALERIAEIQVILEKSGIEARGLGIARKRLKEHTSKAADIVEKEKLRGKDVSSLAGEVVNKINLQKKIVEQIFEKAQKKFLAEKEYLREEFLTAINTKDLEAQKKIRVELAEVKAIKNKIVEKRNAILLALKTEKDRLHDELSDEKRKEEEEKEAREIALKQNEELEKKIRTNIRTVGIEQYEKQLENEELALKRLKEKLETKEITNGEITQQQKEVLKRLEEKLKIAEKRIKTEREILFEEKKKIGELRRETEADEIGQNIQETLFRKILQGNTETSVSLNELFVPMELTGDGQQNNLQQILEHLRNRGLINSEF